MSLLGNVTNMIGTLAQLRRSSTTTSAAPFPVPQVAMGPGPTMAARGLRALSAMPGTGFRTGGGFPSTSSAGFRKRKRTNPTNVKALRRALSRVEGFIKIEKRVDKILRRVAPRARSAARVGFIKRKR